MADERDNNGFHMIHSLPDEPTANRGASLSDLWTPDDEPASASVDNDLGQALLDAGALTAAQLTNARSVLKKSPGRGLPSVVMELGADEVRVQTVVAQFAGMPFERIDPAGVDALKQIQKLGMEFCQANGVLPLRVVGARVLVGVTQPDNLLAIDELRHKLGQSVKPIVVCPSDITAFIENHKEEQVEDEVEVDEIIGDMDEDDVEVVESKEEDLDLEKMAGESPVIRLVNYLIFNAVKEGASDIHIEPQEKRLQVRYRIDGVLFDTMSPPHHMHAAIISRLKIMANLDISERRLPQDGRIRAVVHGRKLDLRLSTLPTAAGEKAVLRILDTRSIQVGLDELGMDEDALLMWKRQIDQPHGILLVTGPTGSGKTTTLYASLAQMDKRRLNISTVEDPVEYHLNGINQTQTHERIGMSFAAALRALLRQDPDVIMVGEIRDSDTARTAIQASLTGHLVLSTLHTNDAPSSVTRLINIGVEPYLIGAALNGTLAQRLVRKICTNCATQVPPDDVTANHLAMHGISLDEVLKGQGCDKCRNTGYAGRVGLYELLLLDDTLRDRIAGNPNVTEFRRTCVERGMVTLREDGFRKVAAGLTTVEEVLRVTESTI
ncbi:MAG: ATPase, T2SS/T4P/T4SS family [Phycisphaeraceae bacterium]